MSFLFFILPGSALASPVECQDYSEPQWATATTEYLTWSAPYAPFRSRRVISKVAQRKRTEHGSHTPDVSHIPNWIRTLLPGLESHFFESSKGRVHYLKGGQGPKVLVFFHGNPTWSFIWRKIIAQLDPEEYTFIAPDLLNLGFSESLTKPGFDKNTPESEKFKMDNVATAMSEFVQYIDSELGLTKNEDVTLVVQDWGGPMGFATAVRNPEIYKKMVILNTGVGIPQELPQFQYDAHKVGIGPWLFRKNLQRPKKAIPKIYSLSQVQDDPESISGLVARAYEYPANLYKNLDMAIHYARMVPAASTENYTELKTIDQAAASVPYFKQHEEFLSQFQGPIQVVWGMSDPVLGPELEKTVKKILPQQAEYTEVKAGHFLQEECPVEIAEAIRKVQ